MEDKALELVNEYQTDLRGFILSKYEATQCAKLDLQHSIELLEEIENSCIGNFVIFIHQEIESLRNQLEHLNSI